MMELIAKEDVLKLLYDVKDNPGIPKNYETIMDLIYRVRAIPARIDTDKVSKEIIEEYHRTCYDIQCEGNCENCGHQKFRNYVSSIISEAVSGKEVWTISEYCKYHNLTKNKVYGMIKNGTLKATKASERDIWLISNP